MLYTKPCSSGARWCGLPDVAPILGPFWAHFGVIRLPSPTRQHSRAAVSNQNSTHRNSTQPTRQQEDGRSITAPQPRATAPERRATAADGDAPFAARRRMTHQPVTPGLPGGGPVGAAAPRHSTVTAQSQHSHSTVTARNAPRALVVTPGSFVGNGTSNAKIATVAVSGRQATEMDRWIVARLPRSQAHEVKREGGGVDVSPARHA